MAEMNSRVDSFISMLLDVSGRARPADLEAHDRVGAEELLREYTAAHPERYLSFDGDTLTVASAPEPVEPLVPEPVIEPVYQPDAEPFAESELPAEAVPAEPFVFDATAIPEVTPMPAEPEPEFLPMPVVPDLSGIPEVIPVSLQEPVLPPDAMVEPPAVTPVEAYDDEAFFEFGPATQGDVSPQSDAVGDGLEFDSTPPEIVITPQPVVADELEFVPVATPTPIIIPEGDLGDETFEVPMVEMPVVDSLPVIVNEPMSDFDDDLL